MCRHHYPYHRQALAIEDTRPRINIKDGRHGHTGPAGWARVPQPRGEQMLGAAPVSAGGLPCFPVGQSRPTACSPDQRLLRPPPLWGRFGFSPGEAGFPGPCLSQAPTTGRAGNTPSTVSVYLYCPLGLAVAYLPITLAPSRWPILARLRWLSLLVHSLALRSPVSALSFSPLPPPLRPSCLPFSLRFCLLFVLSPSFLFCCLFYCRFVLHSVL